MLLSEKGPSVEPEDALLLLIHQYPPRPPALSSLLLTFVQQKTVWP